MEIKRVGRICLHRVKGLRVLVDEKVSVNIRVQSQSHGREQGRDVIILCSRRHVPQILFLFW